MRHAVTKPFPLREEPKGEGAESTYGLRACRATLLKRDASGNAAPKSGYPLLGRVDFAQPGSVVRKLLSTERTITPRC